MTLEAIKEEVKLLPPGDKAVLAGHLVSELFPSYRDEDLAAECEAILDAVDRGDMDTMDGPSFFAQLRQDLKA